MAIIYSYPQVKLSNVSANDLMIISDMNSDSRSTKSLTLGDLASYITSTGTGSGTTNKITRWSDGPSGVLGDSILAQDALATQLTLTGNFIATGTGNFTGQVTIPTTPAAATDAASKNYVDTEVAGIPAGLVFKGNWNANTNTPALASGTGTVGNYYVVSVAGNTNLDGITDWQVGDWAVFVEVGGVDKWDKIDQTFVSGSGAAGQVTFWNTINTVDGDNDFYWDNVNKRLGIGTTSPLSKLHVESDLGAAGTLLTLKNSNVANLNTYTVGTVNKVLKIAGAGSSQDAVLFENTLYVGMGSNTNVGIGTSSPTAKLYVNAGAENLAAQFESTDSISEIRIKDNVAYSRLLNVGTQLKLMPNDGVEMMILDGNDNTVNIPDSKKITFGDSDDLQIFHSSGTNIVDSTIGDLIIKVSQDDGDIIFQSDNGAGAIDTYFRIDGGQLRTEFELGTQHLDNIIANFGSSSDLKIYHNGTDSFIQNSTGDLDIINSQDDGSIVFMCDNGSGGLDTYFSVVGAGNRVQYNKDLRLIDNARATFGSSDDFQIVHNGTDTQLNNLTGNLQFTQLANGKDISFASDNGSGGDTIYFYLDGSDVKNRFNKTVQLGDNVYLYLGDQQDLGMFHNGTSTTINNNTGNLTIKNSANNSDIVFQCDDGSGGLATYFQLDGGDTITRVTRNFRANDNVALQVGVDGDAGMYHDGTNTYFQNDTGNLILLQNTNDGDIIFKSDNGSGGTTEYFRVDGIDTNVRFSKDIKLSDGVLAMFGGSNDLRIYHDGSNSYISDIGTGDLRILGETNIYIGAATGGANMAQFTKGGAVKLRFNDSNKFETTSTGTKTTGQMDLAALNTAVTNSDDNGNVGEIRFTSDYIYVCVADDTWKRVALSTW